MNRMPPAMHVSDVISNQGGKTYRTVLIRSSYRDRNGRSQKKTIANISHLPEPLIELIRNYFSGTRLTQAEDSFEIFKTRKHGAVQAVMTAFEQLDFASLVGSQHSADRDRVLAMVAARIIRPGTKLATVRWWRDTTLSNYLDIEHTDEDDLYAAMDWLLGRQNVIQGKLVRRHLKPGSMALYDLTSTWMEGTQCPLAEFGYNKDGKKGKLQVNFGLLCDPDGRPLGVSVYRGSLRDNQTLIPQVRQLRKRFGIERLVVVGDRGMITQVNIDALGKLKGIDWITALKSTTIKKLMRQGTLSMSRFEDENLFEVLHPSYPDERLVACRNRALAQRRAATRESLLVATENKLEVIINSVANGRLAGSAEIGLKVGEVINSHKVKKHFICEISEHSFSYRRNEIRIAEESALDGVYIIRTSLDRSAMAAAECVRNYKRLSRVERAFRSIKTVSLQVRPVHHRSAERVCAHIFLCMLAYYVEWHMREAWRSLLFSDPELEQVSAERDPVLSAPRSAAAKRKAASKQLDDGTPAYCFRTLIEHLETIAVNHCRNNLMRDVPFEITTSPNDKQQQALDLLRTISYPPRQKRM